MTGPALPTLGGYQLWSDTWVRSGWRVQEDVVGGGSRLLDPRGFRVMSGGRDACVAAGERSAPTDGRRAAVVLLHGMGRTRVCMRPMARAVRAAGFAVANVGYASLLGSPGDHARRVAQVVASLADDGAREVHFVTHSLGGLVARRLCADGLPGARVGRLVLLAAPNRGAAIAERLSGFGPYRVLSGPCGLAVTPAGAAALPVPDAEILVVAGGNGGRGYNPLLGGDNDGVVKVCETRLGDAEAGFLLVRRPHTTIMLCPRVTTAALGFIDTGRASAQGET